MRGVAEREKRQTASENDTKGAPRLQEVKVTGNVRSGRKWGAAEPT